MARGFIGNIQKEAQRLSLEQGEASAPSTTTPPASATDVTAPIEQPKKKKWLMPVLIGGGVLVIGILTYVLLKKNK
jgi:hypothetical protein